MERINRDALFCDETEDYRCPSEADAGEIVTFYFRTEKNGADEVTLLEYDPETGTAVREWPMNRILWENCVDTLRFDFYGCTLTMENKTFPYAFRIKREEDVCLYDRIGVVENTAEHPFRLIPGFHVPEWSKGALMYQIYVDRFCNGDTSNDTETNEYIYLKKPVTRVTDWNEEISTLDVGRFYGGDLKGVLDKLDYLKSLKVEAIYLNPVFVSPSNHKYDCQDYDHIDPHYGVILQDADGLVRPDDMDNDSANKYMMRTADERNLEASDAFFAELIDEAHKRGIRVLVDGVFNHCGSFNKWLDAELLYQHAGGYPLGAYVSSESPYRNFFKFHNENAWPFNDSYDGWWGHATLPKLNYEESPELYQYILNVAKKWVSPPYNADGWRLDVAADLGCSAEMNHRFWHDFRKAVKEANPEAIMIAEHYGSPYDWLKGDQWDTVMNYDAFMEPLSWFLTGMEKHSDEENPALFGDGHAFFEAMKYHMSQMPTASLQCAMNELSNHDHSRFMTRTNRHVGRLATAGSKSAEEGVNYGIFRQGVVIQMTWPGAPTIYYGDEAGVCGWTDPDSRRTYPWGNENQELIEFHRYMSGIRKRCPAFRNGSLKELSEGNGYIAYGRFQSDRISGGECCGITAVNTGADWLTLEIPVWQIGARDGDVLNREMMTYEDGYNAGFVAHEVRNGSVEVKIPPVGSVVLTGKDMKRKN